MTLEALLAEIVSVRDCQAVRRLCVDCWQWAQEHGEEAGLSYARTLLEGVRAYQWHENTVKNFGKWKNNSE